MQPSRITTINDCDVLRALLVSWLAAGSSCGSPLEIPREAPAVEEVSCDSLTCECPDQHYLDETADDCQQCPDYSAPPCANGSLLYVVDDNRLGCDMPVCECPEHLYWDEAFGGCGQCPDHALPPCEGGNIVMVPDSAVPGCDEPVCDCPDGLYWDGWGGCLHCPDYAAPPCAGGTVAMIPDPAARGCQRPVCQLPLETCRDNADNDGDSAVDCDDADCWTDDWCEDAPCGPAGVVDCRVETVCNDGLDDDSDGKVDCADADCYTLSSAGCLVECQSTGGTWDPSSCGHYWCGMAPDCLAVQPGCDCGVGRNFVDGLGCIEDSACPPPNDPCDSLCAPFTIPFATCTYPSDDTTDPRCQNDMCAHEDVFGYSYCVGNQLWVHPACVVPLYCDPELAQICPGPENQNDRCVCTCANACAEDLGFSGSNYPPPGVIRQAACAGEDRLPIECPQISSVDLPVYSALVTCGAAPTEGTQACLVLLLGTNGTVTDVRAGTEGLQLTPENVDCARNALVGTSTPSLAGESCIQTCEWGV